MPTISSLQAIANPSAAIWLPLLAALLLALLAYGAVRLSRWLVANDRLLWDVVRRWRPWLERVPGIRALERRFPAVLGFMRARLSATEYLSVHLIVGVLVCLVAIYGFGNILLAVIDKKDLTEFDRHAARTLYRVATPWGVAFWGFVSRLGTYPVMAVFVGIITALLWRRGERLFPLVALIAMAGASLLNDAFKVLVHRARPFWVAPFASESTFSFPSGHSLGAVVGYGMLAYGIYLLTRPGGVWLPAMIGCLIIALAIGYSRMYLGVHFFSDVIGGFALGGFWMAACITGHAVARQRGDLGAQAAGHGTGPKRARVA